MGNLLVRIPFTRCSAPIDNECSPKFLGGRDRPNGPGQRLKEVVKALWNIPPKEICERLLTTQDSMHDITLNPTMMGHCVSTLWETFGSQLEVPRSNGALEVIADVLFKNEEEPLVPSPDDGFEWLNTFMGGKLRLEMLGVLFCFFGKAYLTLQEWDPTFKIPENFDRDRKETAWRMKECADICRTMCHYSETVNEILAALCYNIAILESLVTGDESKSCFLPNF